MKKSVCFSFLVIFLILSLSIASFAAVPDGDNDGVPDNSDYCPGSTSNLVDQYGCSCAQKNDANYCSAGGRASVNICCPSTPSNPCINKCGADNVGKAACNIPLTDGTTCYIPKEEDYDTGKCQAGKCVLPSQPKCSDGVINQPTESCDGNDFSGKTCKDFGYSSGNLKCSNDCKIDTSGCVSQPKCTDSDKTKEYPDGKNYYEKGVCKDSSGKEPWEDSCTPSSADNKIKLEEVYCNDNDNNCYGNMIECPNGCKDGACIKSNGCSSDADCPIDAPQCDGFSCVGCKTSVCIGGKHSGGDSTCCLKGTGKGIHFEKYDDKNFECWSSCTLNPVCGNGICEEGEADNCPLCKKGDACPPCIHGTCPNDCKTQTCTDTDASDQIPDGKNYYMKGEVPHIEGYPPNIDTCINSNNLIASEGPILLEYFCEGSSRWGNEKHLCSNGCKDGACIAKTQEQGFKFAVWGCAGGHAESHGDESICEPLETWYGYSKDSCGSNAVDFFNVFGACAPVTIITAGSCARVPIDKCGATPGCEVVEKRDWKKLYLGTTKECTDKKK